MAVTYSIFYFDGINFSSAVALYSDAALTTLAADGFYAQNGIVRQQVGGVLLNAQSCTTCAQPCGSGVSASITNQPGYFNADIDVANSVGAVVLYFYMGSSIPDGVIATFNNVAYNKMTSQNNHNGVTLVDGTNTQVDYAGINNLTSVPDRNTPTYVGRQNNGLAGNYTGVPEYNLLSGNYVATGITRSINVTSNQIGYAQSSSPVFTMVVPKTDVNTTIVNVQIFAPMTGTAFSWEVACPADLPSFSGSAVQSTDSCASATTTYFFVVNATGTTAPFTKDTNTTPEIGNFVYVDSAGQTPVNDTNTLSYIIINNATALGIRNGVVVSLAACSGTSPGLTAFNSSLKQTNINPICDGATPPTTSQTFYHNGSGTYPAIGDTCFITASGVGLIAEGFYYLFSNAGANTYMQVNISGVVTAVNTCSPPTTTFFMSGGVAGCSTFCNGNYLITQERGTTNNHSYANLAEGDVIAGSTLANGWYAYANTQTSTLNTGNFKIMELGGGGAASNTVTAIGTCNGGSCTIQ